MRRICIGLDISKGDIKAAVKDDRNNQLMPIRTYSPNIPSLTELANDIEEVRRQYPGRVIYGMEATGIYHIPVYRFLQARKAEVKVFNSLELRRYKARIRRTKTDKLDALAIAEALVFSVEPIYAPENDPKRVKLRELCRLRDRIVTKASITKSQAKRVMDVLCRGYTSVFDDVFSESSLDVLKASVRITKLFELDVSSLETIFVKYHTKPVAEKKARELHRIFRENAVPELERDVCILEIHMLIQEYQVYQDQIKRLDNRIVAIVSTIETKLLTVPGIGHLTAGILLGELGDLKRFRSIGQLTAFAGLDTVVYDSGKTHRTGHISKRGSPMLRGALYKAALPAIQFNPVCKAFYERLKSKGKHSKICLVAVARKLLHIAYSVESRNRDFYVPSYLNIKTA